MDVPTHLLNPPAGGWPIHQAAGLWAWLCYAIPPTAPDTTEVGRIRNQAFREIRAIATQAPAGALPTRPTIRRRTSTWLPSSDDPPLRRQVVPSAPPADWVTQPALEALAARHGVSYGQPQPPAAVAPVVALEQAPGGDERQVAPGGRPSTNAEAYAYIDELLARGMRKNAAYLEAASKFPSPGVAAASRASTLGAGYRQDKRNNRE
mgnify:CR=1 FL=1